mmetsp:Transcript_105523/g.308571  ORF Transcript_105523/g.308571 Transcript_105523/m.308571 type:complete len:473 (+) Transcript_105523:56-1474(+)
MPSAVLAALAALTAAAAPAPGEPGGHWWPRGRGHVGKYGTSELPGPRNLTAQLAWKWQHPELGVVTGALLDDRRNIYVSAIDGIRKFSPDGNQVWHWQGQHVFHVPSLMDDALYGATIEGLMFKLSLETGREVWLHRHAEVGEMDCAYVEVSEGVVLAAFKRDATSTGNQRIVAANASSGGKLWEFVSDTVLWNFQPQFPDDGTFIVMDIHGGLRRLSVLAGDQVAYVPPPESWMLNGFTDGGVILGPGGKTAYTCSNMLFPFPNSNGALRAYRVSDLQLLWQVVLPQPCVTWPASDGHNVVVPVGGLPESFPPYMQVKWLPGVIRDLVLTFDNWLGDIAFFHRSSSPMLFLAFDAETGAPRWTYDRIKPWPRICSRGDEAHFIRRTVRWPSRPVCGPASWSAVTISGDGTAYAAAMNGVLYAIRDANSDGVIDDSEVSMIDVGDASLHQGQSFAPGMMTHATCAGVYVFRT